MNVSSLPLVLGKEGVLGRLDNAPERDGTQRGLALIRLEDGRQMHVPHKVLYVQEDGSFILPFTLAELERTYGSGTVDADGSITVPVMAEELHVGTRMVETGRVLIHKTMQEREETVDPPLLRQRVVVEHVAVNRLCEGDAPSIRHEGDTMIIPVLEEVLVVEKRLMLVEEIHVRQEQSTFHAPQRVRVRREAIQVERVATPEGSESATTLPTS